MIVRRFKKVSRNSLCRCGSGKKFKYCECYQDLKDQTIKYIDLSKKHE